MRSDPRPTIVLPYRSEFPSFRGAPQFCGPRTAVLGRATLGSGLVLGVRASIRADGDRIRAGEDFCLGPRSTIHIAHETRPTLIGDRVAVGANAVIHACTIADDVAIEDDVVVLDGVEVESQTVIARGSIVFPRTHVEAGLWAGMPARRVRTAEPGEVAAARRRIVAQSWAESASLPAGSDERARLVRCLYVAPTARVVGAVDAEDSVSIWFGCEIDAGASTITIGARSNLQDNTEISCPAGPVTIGCDSAMGHNVRLESCTIGERSLIANGAFVQSGTIVEAEVLLAAGAVTEPGQRLAGGWMWGGRPARRLSRLDAKRFDQIAAAVWHYLHYGADFRAAAP